MIDEAIYDSLDRYWSGEMNGEERAAFDARLQTDPELREELEWLRAASAAMKTTGRTVLKAQIASALAGIPATALEHYSPSVPKKSFLKKWWWAIAGLAAAAIAVSVWYFVFQKHSAAEAGNDNNTSHSRFDAVTPEANDSVKQNRPGGEAAPAAADSCAIDSLMKTSRPVSPDESHTEQVLVDKAGNKTERYYDVENGNTKLVLSAASRTDSITKKRPMNINLSPKPNTPAAYIFEEDITLYGPYTTTQGLRFSGKGDTIIMTDGQPGFFRLIKGGGKKPLVKINRSYGK